MLKKKYIDNLNCCTFKINLSKKVHQVVCAEKLLYQAVNGKQINSNQNCSVDEGLGFFKKKT